MKYPTQKKGALIVTWLPATGQPSYEGSEEGCEYCQDPHLHSSSSTL